MPDVSTSHEDSDGARSVSDSNATGNVRDDDREETRDDVNAVVDELLNDVTGKQHGKPDKIDLGRYDSFAPELMRFWAPDELPPEHEQLVTDIVVLDHRSLHALGPHTPARAEVKALLQNAAITAGYMLVDYGGQASDAIARPIGPASALYKHAAEIFDRHVESRNRMQYLLGVLIGIALLVLVALSARYLPDGVKIAFPAEFLPALIFFAGLGSIVSVVMRLSKLDVVREISRSILLISGLGRPFVASAFALVIYLIISNKLIAIAVGATDAADDGVGTYLVIAFLCGFSERFAQDILDRTERGFGPPVKQNE